MIPHGRRSRHFSIAARFMNDRLSFSPTGRQRSVVTNHLTRHPLTSIIRMLDVESSGDRARSSEACMKSYEDIGKLLSLAIEQAVERKIQERSAPAHAV